MTEVRISYFENKISFYLWVLPMIAIMAYALSGLNLNANDDSLLGFNSILVTVQSSTSSLAEKFKNKSSLTQQQVAQIIKQSMPNNPLHIQATPEVVKQINKIRKNAGQRKYMQLTLDRMQKYKSTITAEFKKQAAPIDLIALPIIETHYQDLPQSKNKLSNAAGLWQLIPSTARHYGLTVKKGNDERLNPALATRAAIHYLKEMHDQFNDWNLAIMSYNQGEGNTHHEIKRTGSEVMRRIAAPMVGGMISATLLTLLVIPAMFLVWQRAMINRS